MRINNNVFKYGNFNVIVFKSPGLTLVFVKLIYFRADSNEDGRITREEVQEVRFKMFKKYVYIQ